MTTDTFTYTVSRCDNEQCSNGVWHHGKDSSIAAQCKRSAVVMVEGAPFCTAHAGMFIANGIANIYKDNKAHEIIDTRRHEE